MVWCSDRAVCADLFAALVPLRVRGALQAADARRAELVAAEINKLRDATQLLNRYVPRPRPHSAPSANAPTLCSSILASLNLPACLEETGAGALPDSIRGKAAAVRAAGGAPELARLMQELPDLLQRNRDILNEVLHLRMRGMRTDSLLLYIRLYNSGRCCVAGGAHGARGGAGGRGAARAVRRALDPHGVRAAHGGLRGQRRQVPPDHRQRRARRQHRARQVPGAQGGNYRYHSVPHAYCHLSTEYGLFQVYLYLEFSNLFCLHLMFP